MKYTIFDIETDGLLKEVSKIYCLSYCTIENGIEVSSGTYTEKEDILCFLSTNDCLVGHNIIRYDLPALKKLLGVDYKGRVIDTLGVSWYLYPNKRKHSLEEWGEELKVSKVKIEDWDNLNIEDYIKRCETDVKINTYLWVWFEKYLSQLYDGSFNKILSYINFKLECLLEQELVGIHIDLNLCMSTKSELEDLVYEKTTALEAHMPKVIKYTAKNKPKNLYRKDGSYSVKGQEWFDALKEFNLPDDTEVIPNYKTSYEEPNAGSYQQLKSWLDSMGWIPKTFKENDKKEEIPQLSLPHGGGICPSVKRLYDQEPNLIHLEGLYVAKHRLGKINAFLEHMDSEGKVYGTAHGFTNTMRLKHSAPTENLPKVGLPYGKEIRGCFIVPSKHHIMFGSDIAGLEDYTKQHYLYFYDPEYVKSMQTPDFDPHLDIALQGGFMTEDDVKFYKSGGESDKDRMSQLKKIRHSAKTSNFAATYNAFPAAIARGAGISLEDATKLHTTYWERNWAIESTVKGLIVKKVNYQKWQWNPIAGLWYFLKADKDQFSTLNQGSGVYVFDFWLKKVRQKLKTIGVSITYQYHDEIKGVCLRFQKAKVESLIKEAMEEVNKELKLNVTINCSTAFGNNYADIH